MNSGGVQIRVSDMIFALKKRWKMILALTFMGLVFGVLIYIMTYVQDSVRSYEVSGSLAISTQNHAEGVYITGTQIANNNDFHLAEDMADAVIYVLRSDTVLSEVIRQEGLLGTTVEDLRSALTVTQYQATQILEMHFTWRTEEEAQTIWNDIVDAANQTIPETLQLGQLRVINQPESVQSSVISSGRALPFLFMFLGFLGGIGVAVTELMVRPTLTNTRDAETMFGLETIGMIPQDVTFFRKRQNAMLVSDIPDHSNVLQNYSAAAYILRNRLSSKEQHHCFYVTSTTTGEGKTTAAANLAVQLSDMEHRTLLVDLDTRNPSLGTLFMEKVEYSHSLNALYRGDAIEEDVITPLTGYLDLLPAVREHIALSLDGTVSELIQRLSGEYDYVILDSAPVGEASEVLGLNRIAGTVLFVIRYDSTPLPSIQSALEKLDKSGIRVLGCIINRIGGNGAGARDKKESHRSVRPRGKTEHSYQKERAENSEPNLAELTGDLEPGVAAFETAREYAAPLRQEELQNEALYREEFQKNESLKEEPLKEEPLKEELQKEEFSKEEMKKDSSRDILSELTADDDFAFSDGRSAQSVLEELLAWTGEDDQ